MSYWLTHQFNQHSQVHISPFHPVFFGPLLQLLFETLLSTCRSGSGKRCSWNICITFLWGLELLVFLLSNAIKRATGTILFFQPVNGRSAIFHRNIPTGQVWPTWTNLNQITHWPTWTNFDKLWPTLTNLDQLWQTLTNLDHFWPLLILLWPLLAVFGHFWLFLATFDQP